jgi:hypothetical protein
MRKLLLSLMLLVVGIAQADTFMRGTLVDTFNPGDAAYIQLWNPAGSGINAHVSKVYLGDSCQRLVFLWTEVKLETPAFAVPQGLNLEGDEVVNRSKAEVRKQGVPDEPGIIGGQYLPIDKLDTPLIIEEPFIVKPGRGLLIRCAVPEEALTVAFSWTESP